MFVTEEFLDFTKIHDQGRGHATKADQNQNR